MVYRSIASHTASKAYTLGRGTLKNEALPDEEKTGTLALLAALDRSAIYPVDGDSHHPIDLTTALDGTPGPSCRRHSPPSLNDSASSLPSSSRLFDEGSLNPDLTFSANSSSESIKPGESVVSKSPENPGKEEKPEDRKSPLQWSSSVKPRRIKRPDVQLDSRLARRYSWMRESRSPESTSTRSSRSYKKSSSKHHVSPVKTSLRSPASQRRLRIWNDIQTMRAEIGRVVAGDEDVGHAGSRVLSLLRPKRNSATNELLERHFRKRQP